MGCRNFRLWLAAQVAGICATSFVIALVAANTSYYATLALVTLILAIQVTALARYVEHTNRELGRFLSAVRHADFSQSFTMDRPGGSFAELSAAFEDILVRFRDARTQKEEQASYLDAVVQHIPIAVIAFDPSGRVDLFNTAARRLLGIAALRNVRDYAGFGDEFPERLLGLQPGAPRLIQVSRDDVALKLNAAATELRLSGRVLTIVTLQDIRRELEARELATWQDLIRVLTHEIMNSVTPISSLAGTAARLLKDAEDGSDRSTGHAGQALTDVRDAVDTIAARSAGLLRFAEGYRRLTRVPEPDRRPLRIAELFARLGGLMQPELGRRAITFSTSIDPPTLELAADEALIEQALLNLLKNAIDAVEDVTAGQIHMGAELTTTARVVVRVSDNGTGMSDQVREKLFIPFFTTKRHGTGVGLSLVRQILRAHGGDVAVTSSPGRGTEVRLRF